MYSILNIQMRFDFSSVEHQLNLSINFPNFSILLIVSFRAAAEPVFPSEAVSPAFCGLLTPAEPPVSNTGASQIFPEPRYTLTRPSPDTAEPTKDLEDFSTVKSKEDDQAIAIFPSIFIISLSSTTSIISFLGTILSKAQIPVPFKLKLNRPSLPNTAEERLLLATTFCVTVLSQARNNPSSKTTLPPHSCRFVSRM